MSIQNETLWTDDTLRLKGWPFSEHYRNPNTAWDPSQKALFLFLYIAFWVCVVLAVAWRNRMPYMAKKPTTSSTAAVGKAVPDPSGLACGIGPKPTYPRQKLVHEFFLERALASPQLTALILPSTAANSSLQGDTTGEAERRVVTYGELREAIMHLSATLRQLGVQLGSIAALSLHRSCAQVVAVHAVLVAGGGYLPMDHTAPLSRKKLLISDSEAQVLVVHKGDQEMLTLSEELSISSVIMEPGGRQGAYSTLQVRNPKSQGDPYPMRPETTDTAMLIYTSGSSGKPKGIIYDHAHLLHGAWFWAEEHGVSEDSVLFLKSPYFWAVIEWELFPALMRGGRLVIAAPEGHKSPEYMAAVIKEEKVGVLMMTPSVLDVLIDVHEAQGKPLQSLRHVTTVGEPLPTELANRFTATAGLESACLRNFYGASESCCTVYKVPSGGVDTDRFPNKVPAGISQAHAEVYIMAIGQRPLRPLLLGESGEICFAGVLAAGYFKLPEMTEKCFLDTSEYGRVYTTGDLGRWNGGVLEVLGRIDRQVKVNGVRIEPEEVESVLKKFVQIRKTSRDDAPSEGEGDVELALLNLQKSTSENGNAEEELHGLVTKAAAVATAEPSTLIAFVQLRATSDRVSSEDLLDHCKKHLTSAYMPRQVVIMYEGLPLLPNGKVDFGKLKGLAEEHAMDVQEAVLDSMGQMRSMSKMAILENAVIHRCYAFWMLGVLIDHYCHCALTADPNDADKLMPYCTALATDNTPPWSEMLIRSLGNDQDLFGFIMLGAYQDTRTKRKGQRPVLRPRWLDMYIFCVYLFMALPLPQFLSFITGGWAWPDKSVAMWNTELKSIWDIDYMMKADSTSGHRWYLLMLLQAKFFVWICNSMCLPPWLQVLLASWSSYIGPVFSGNVCTDDRSSYTSRYFLVWVFDGCWTWVRWVEWYATFYVFCFHYLRQILDWLTPKLPRGPVWAATATAFSMTIGLLMAMLHYPNEIIETGSDSGWGWLEILATMLQPALFALGTSYWSVNASWWGNTTLGCYMIHFCFRDRMTELMTSLSVALSGDPTGLVLPMSIILVCFAFTSTIGPMGHYILILPQLTVAWIQRQRRFWRSAKSANGKAF